MKRWIARALTLLFFLAAAPGGLCFSTPAADAYFARLFDKSGAVNGAVLISQGGERIYESYYGAEDRRTKVPVSENTVYKVASVSKMVSAMGVMRLYDAGLADLDAGLPGIRNPRYPDVPVTLRQVMSHTSSILSAAPYLTPPEWSGQDAAGSNCFSRYQPGAHYEYANLNGGILCSVIERVSGQSFNTFMAENIFGPLGINAAYAAHLLRDSTHLATAYYSDNSVFRRASQYIEIDAEAYEDTCDPDRHYHASASSLYISLSGLEKLGRALAGDGSADGVRVLSGQAVRLMRMDQAALPGSSVTGSSPYGLCVNRFTDSDGITWYGHQGRWEGLLTDLFFEPVTQTVVVLVLDGTKAANNGQGIHPRAEDALTFADAWVHEAETNYVVKDD
ncbi:MAG: beta-lactamase family protein [Clostridia bacterium]|nr:beta-lactamase family protein [Clostridia bacterium]